MPEDEKREQMYTYQCIHTTVLWLKMKNEKKCIYIIVVNFIYSEYILSFTFLLQK